jgi:hypothetical protein
MIYGITHFYNAIKLKGWLELQIVQIVTTYIVAASEKKEGTTTSKLILRATGGASTQLSFEESTCRGVNAGGY